MLKKLELESIQAEIGTIDRMLAERDEKTDPLGVMQYRLRRQSLLEEIAGIESNPETSAEIALFFGGRPVLGSKGISSEFATKAIGGFQALVANKYALKAKPRLPIRGPTPQRDQSALLITDIVRGSLGFVLTEADADPSLVDSKLKEAVSETGDLIYRFSAADSEALDLAYDEIDLRILRDLSAFFSTMDGAGATIRVVQGDRDYSLSSDDIVRARSRAEALEVKEKNDIIVQGSLYFCRKAAASTYCLNREARRSSAR